MNVPPEFFKSLSEDEKKEIVESDGILNRRLCRRLWAMQSRTDKPPHRLRLFFSSEDIMREFPPFEKMH